MLVNTREFEEWCEGGLAQNVFKSLSVVKRDQLITHMCPECMKAMYGDTYDKDDDNEQANT